MTTWRAVAFAVGLVLSAPAWCQTVDTPRMRLTFEQGWLVGWENKEAGEKVEFGRPKLSPADRQDYPYAPGPWIIDRLQPKDLSTIKATATTTVAKLDDTAAQIVQSAQWPEGEVQAVQWGVYVPFEQVDALHFPNGLSPARIAAKDSPGEFFERKNYHFSGRPGALSFHEWRQRYYIIQGRKGGLVIHVDDAELEHRPAVEYRKSAGGILLSNRSIMNPPWKDRYTGCRWVVRQYTGWVGAGAQVYQDYLMKTYRLTPLKDRPTGWVTKLAYCNVKPGLEKPLPFPGKPNSFNYSTDWDKTIAYLTQWLKNFSQVLPPESVLLYDTGWGYTGMDVSYPDHSINPLLAYTLPIARGMGYHYMPHFNAQFAYLPFPGAKRFIENQWAQQGVKTQVGVAVCALRNQPHVKTADKAGAHYLRQGIDYDLTRYGMTPAYEGWRRLFVAMVVSTVKACGADMLHVDVPSIPIELHNDRYGMNAAQGLREQFKLLRETLDANGLGHVAIACELTPSEPILPYVDLSQASRDTSALSFLNNPAKAGEVLIELQTGAELAAVEKERAAQAAATVAPFAQELYRKALAAWRDLGEPSVDGMVSAKFCKGYPHLGTVGPLSGGNRGDPNAAVHHQVAQALTVWYGFTRDTLLHDILMPPALMESPAFSTAAQLEERKKELASGGLRRNGKTLTRFHYVKFALARFWQAATPLAMEPRHWERGDIGRYQLNDGRVLRITRSGPLVMRFAFGDGSVLAELDLFEGWKNCDRLLKEYEPTWLKDQIDEWADGGR